MKRAAIFVGVLLLLCAAGAQADQVGPTWNLLAGGVFSADPSSLGAESFSLDWTINV
jgi:hypothetical protein